jgi:hypothetical protein
LHYGSLVRNAAVVAVVAVAVVAVLTLLVVGLLVVTRSPSSPQTAAIPSPSTTATPSPSASTATPAPSPVATSPSGSLYVNQTYRFSLTLPEPYRKSARLSLINASSQNPSAPVAQDAFTARTEPDEAELAAQRCAEIACPIRNYVAYVVTYAGVSQTLRQWYRSHGGALGEQIDDTTVDGRPAIRVTNGIPPFTPMQVIVQDGDRLVVVMYQVYPNMALPAGTSKDTLDQILASFKFTR